MPKMKNEIAKYLAKLGKKGGEKTSEAKKAATAISLKKARAAKSVKNKKKIIGR